MLVLARREGEIIEIGDSIQVVVVECRGDLVRLGIVAPKDIPVHRSEIAAQIRGKNSQDSQEPNP